MTVVAILVAAGRGTRAGGGLPKQWRPLAGDSVFGHALAALRAAPGVDAVMAVLHPDDMDRAPGLEAAGLRVVAGGETRDASVRAALLALEGTGADRVLIHDAARPLVTPALVARLIAALDGAEAAAPGLPVTDALWRGEGGRVTGAVPRGGLFRAQTPQAFRLAPLIAAHRAHAGGAADDVEVARAAGLDVVILQGEEDNLKITHPGDFARAAAILAGRSARMDIRLGNGFDVHRLIPGDGVTLCGVTIPFDRRLEGHSDADVAMHALTDAIYGALAAGDIGRHFPPSDPQWKGAASEIFLAHAGALAAGRGYAIANCDVTIICEAPRIGPHAAAMQAELSRILALSPDRISVKATTSERLGFTGREEGIAAMATAALVRRPEEADGGGGRGGVTGC